MIFSREYVGYLARQTVKHLVEAKMIQTAKLKAVEDRVTQGLIEELSLEDRINEEVRVILDARLRMPLATSLADALREEEGPGQDEA